MENELNQLEELINTGDNRETFNAVAAAYEVLANGVPTIEGFEFLINNANETNFGAGGTVEFNEENKFINIANALTQGNDDAATNFQGLIAGQATLQDKIEALYRALVPLEDQSEAGLDFLTRPDALDFYRAVAAERDVGVDGATDDGAAVVALASLLKILQDEDTGLGDDVNDLYAAISDGSAQLPLNGDVFTPIEDADGVNFDGDDVESQVGDTFTLTTAADAPGAGLPAEDTLGTDGNDTYRAITADSLQTVDVINGGLGFDTINAAAGAIEAGAVPVIENVERINFQGANTLDFSEITGTTEIENSSADFVAVTNVELGTEVRVSGTGSFAVGFAGVAGLADAATVVGAGAAGGGTVLVAGIENVTVEAEADSNFTLDGDVAETLTITGDSALVLDASGTFIANLESVNASAATGDITFNALDNGNNQVTELTLGAGNDETYYDTDFNNGGDGGEAVTIGLGAGNDQLTLALYDSASNLTATTVDVTVGAGSDFVLVAEDFSNIYDATEEGIEAGLVSIADFDVAEDTLDTSAVTTGQEVLTNVQLADIADEATLLDAVTLAATFGTAAAEQVTVFDFGGNAYVFNDADGSNTFTADDGLIELVGVSVDDLDAANFAA